MLTPTHPAPQSRHLTPLEIAANNSIRTFEVLELDRGSTLSQPTYAQLAEIWQYRIHAKYLRAHGDGTTADFYERKAEHWQRRWMPSIICFIALEPDTSRTDYHRSTAPRSMPLGEMDLLDQADPFEVVR